MKPTQLQWDVEEKILEVANLYNEVTTSDLQGIATVTAKEILNEVKKDILQCKSNDLEKFKKCLENKGLM